jgi:hypothetical protein
VRDTYETRWACLTHGLQICGDLLEFGVMDPDHAPPRPLPEGCFWFLFDLDLFAIGSDQVGAVVDAGYMEHPLPVPCGLCEIHGTDPLQQWT